MSAPKGGGRGQFLRRLTPVSNLSLAPAKTARCYQFSLDSSSDSPDLEDVPNRQDYKVPSESDSGESFDIPSPVYNEVPICPLIEEHDGNMCKKIIGAFNHSSPDIEDVPNKQDYKVPSESDSDESFDIPSPAYNEVPIRPPIEEHNDNMYKKIIDAFDQSILYEVENACQKTPGLADKAEYLTKTFKERFPVELKTRPCKKELENYHDDTSVSSLPKKTVTDVEEEFVDPQIMNRTNLSSIVEEICFDHKSPSDEMDNSSLEDEPLDEPGRRIFDISHKSNETSKLDSSADQSTFMPNHLPFFRGRSHISSGLKGISRKALSRSCTIELPRPKSVIDPDGLQDKTYPFVQRSSQPPARGKGHKSLAISRQRVSTGSQGRESSGTSGSVPCSSASECETTSQSASGSSQLFDQHKPLTLRSHRKASLSSELSSSERSDDDIPHSTPKPASTRTKKSSDYGFQKMEFVMEKMEKCSGILHGIPDFKPASSISDLKLHKDMANFLSDKKFRDLTRSQMYGIPTLLEKRNMILVGPPLSGKTVTCLIGMLHLALHKSEYTKLDDWNGPVCVILTTSSRKVNEMDFILAPLKNYLKIVKAFGGGLELEIKGQLASHSDVLITTPRCWLRLLRYKNVTNIRRLCHLVIDDAHVLLDLFKTEINTILLLCKHLEEHRKAKNIPFGLQYAFVGQHWTNDFEDVLKNLESPVVVFTSHLEAALYSKIKVTVRVLLSGTKLNKLSELLVDSYNKRTVVVCKDKDEVVDLSPQLPIRPNEQLVAHEKMGISAISDISHLWETKHSSLLLCTDAVISDLAISNAEHLIHYSLPQSKSYFSERFSLVQENFVDRVQNPEGVAKHCSVNILVDNDNVTQFPDIVTFMERLKTPIPKNVSDIVQNINFQKEEAKTNLPFCENILMFGECTDVKICQRRHIFLVKNDSAINVPLKGFVKGMLSYIHNPSRYSIRILATRGSENEPWQDAGSSYLLISIKMNSYYSKRENRKLHGVPQVGDMVAVEVEVDTMFKRAIVTKIISRNEKSKPSAVSVRFIDEGYVHDLKVVKLLYLPPELQKFDGQAYDVYLSGISPIDLDPEWNINSIKSLQKSYELAVRDAQDHFFVAKVVLSVSSNMIATSFLCYERLETTKTFAVIFSARRFLIDSGFAILNKKHLPNIMNLALQAGIIKEYPTDLLEVDEKEQENQDIEVPQWEELEKDKFYLSHVIAMDSPSLFYLTIRKSAQRLSSLEKEMGDTLTKKSTKSESIEEGMVCAVKNAESWNRAKVVKVNGNEVDVLFVDYGDISTVQKENIAHIPKGFISKLPFQAIECSLVGIVPTDGSDWDDEAIDLFESLTNNEEGLKKPLYARACEVKESLETGGPHFEILLIDRNDTENTLINKELLQNAVANWSSKTKTYLKDKSYINFESCPLVPEKDAASEENTETQYSPEDNSETLVQSKNKFVTVIENLDDSDSETWSDSDVLDPARVGNNGAISVFKRDYDSKDSNDNVIDKLIDGDFDFVFNDESFKQMKNEFVQCLPPPLRDPMSNALEGERLKAIEAPPEGQKEISECNDIAEGSFLKSTVAEKNPSKELEPLEKLPDNSELEFENIGLIYVPSLWCKILRDSIQAPVIWSQTHTHVKLKIDLLDIKEYCFEVYKKFGKYGKDIVFVCLSNQKYYSCALELFGAVSVDVKPLLTGLYFEVKLEKLLPGHDWPRLTKYALKNSKRIKLDVGTIIPADVDPIEFLLKRAETHKESKEEYLERMAAREWEKQDPFSIRPEAYSETDSAGSDFSDEDSEEFLAKKKLYEDFI